MNSWWRKWTYNIIKLFFFLYSIAFLKAGFIHKSYISKKLPIYLLNFLIKSFIWFILSISLEDVVTLNEDNFLTKNLGKKSLDEIAECLNNLGYGEDFELPDSTRVNLVKKIEQLKESSEAKK